MLSLCLKMSHFCFPFCFETGSDYIAYTDFELQILLKAWITGTSHHTWLILLYSSFLLNEVK
jgi:hypothetical protein